MLAGTSRRLVAIDLPAGPDFVAALDAVWAAGDAALPLPADPDGSRRSAMMDAMRPGAIVDAAGQHELAGGLPVTAGTALVLVTSGSTGAAKGVVLSHAAIEASARATVARLGEEPGDRWLCCLPLSHVAGLQILVRARLSGHQPIIRPGFEPSTFTEEHGATLVSLVPTMLVRLLDAQVGLSGFRAILLGGAPPAPGLLERARGAGARVVVTYGMTETCGGCVYDGVPLDGAEVAVGADGRIRIRGPMLMDGYRGQTSPTVDPEGWFTTSDLGRWEEGRLAVLGRADDVIITGGENVVPAQVEAVLADHPAVDQVAVVGRVDLEWGERVTAVVVPRGDAPSLADLRAHARPRLPRHALPAELEVVQVLPLLATGKVDRDALRRAPAGPEPR